MWPRYIFYKPVIAEIIQLGEYSKKKIVHTTIKRGVLYGQR